MHVLNVNQ